MVCGNDKAVQAMATGAMCQYFPHSEVNNFLVYVMPLASPMFEHPAGLQATGLLFAHEVQATCRPTFILAYLQ